MLTLLFLLSALFLTAPALAADTGAQPTLVLTTHWVGFVSIAIFVAAYTLVILEEKLQLRKSKPVLAAAGIIWILIAIAYGGSDRSHDLEAAIRHNFLEYAELFFFLLVAMTYIHAMLERGVFDVLRDWLVKNGFGYRALFWLTGIFAFLISPIADNLTTSLIMCAVILAVGDDQPKFVAIACGRRGRA